MGAPCPFFNFCCGKEFGLQRANRLSPLLKRTVNATRTFLTSFGMNMFFLALRELCGILCVLLGATHKLNAGGLERPHVHAEFSVCRSATSVGGRYLAGSYAFRPLHDGGRSLQKDTL